MSDASNSDLIRWEELQAIRLLFGLSAEEQSEYDNLAPQMPADEPQPFERVVASLDLAWSKPSSEPLPEHLRQAVRTQAERELAATKSMVSPAKEERRHSRAIETSRYLPWFVSAACLLIACLTWFASRPAQQAIPTVAQLRAEMLAGSKDLLQLQWSAGTTPVEGAKGDIVWSASQQAGFMRFEGLPANNPTKEQYQLWIFDKNQSDKTPVDGGVFDISTAAEVIVPIQAKLKVQEPFLFAVTIEKPGGVVVSSRERLPLLAKVE